MASTVPKVVSVEVVPAQPTETDSTMIAQLSEEVGRPISEEAFIVKIGLAEIPPPTAHGWALYVGDTRIPKYWEYPGGIYFKVLDEEFLAEHQREKLRFSENGVDFIDTGVKLPSLVASGLSRKPQRAGRKPQRAGRVANVRSLPRQSEVLNQSVPGRATRRRAARKSARPARAKSGRKARKRRGRK